MELQHINVKIYLNDAGQSLNVEDIIPVFHRCIQKQAFGELLIDVADYSHVPLGPGVVLVAHEAIYSVEPGPENRIGLLYNVKIKREGSNADRVKQALGEALKACVVLEEDEVFKGKYKFQTDTVWLAVNDRMLCPNEQATFDAVESDLQAGFAAVYGDATVELAFIKDDARNRFTVQAKAASSQDVAGLVGAAS